jgi:hypothetical protein
MALGTEKQYYTFIKGLVTEASPLTFPENASLDEDNFVLERNGSRNRRLGVDFEAGFSLIPSGYSTVILADTKISFHVWDTPNGDSSLSIGVVRILDRLWFVNLFTSNPSGNLLNNGNALVLPGLSNEEIDTTVIDNKMLVVSKDLSLPLLLNYNNATDVVTYQTVPVSIRDFFGVYDSIGNTVRPSSITNTYRYNLNNQNWSNANINSTAAVLGVYPSNSDIWYLARYSDPTQANFNDYAPGFLVRSNNFNARAPKGSAIIDVFFRGNGRSAFSAITGLPSDIETGSFTTVASYAGRAFYSGVRSVVTGGDLNSPNYSGYVFFSQVVTSPDAIGKCYQVNDPTAEEISDVVDSDGGTIQIPEANKILKLVPSKGSLLVFAENGIWEIFGGSSGFTATSFQLSKVSSTGVLSKDSVVEVNGSFLCWTNGGIYLIAEDQVTGRYKADNITLNTIQTYYNTISDIAKQNVKSFYSVKENKVRWLYNDTTNYGVGNYLTSFNRELVFDLTLGAFYTNTFSELANNSPKICGYIDFPGITVASVETEVYADNERVVDTANETIVVNNLQATNRSSQFGYLTLYQSSFTISKLSNTSFVDWQSVDTIGAPFESYLVTGYEIMGDASRKKQVPYLMCYFEKTESGFTEIDGSLEIDNPSSCIIQAQWNWANSSASGKWGVPFQAYRLKRPYFPTGTEDTYDSGERVIVTKNKLRGIGKALSIKFQSEPNKDLRILGWSTSLTANDKV